MPLKTHPGPILAAMTILLSTFLLVAIGCSSQEEGPALIPVVGKITFDGKPATEGAVVFRGVGSSQFQPAGLISSDGTYNIYSGQREGAPAGEYRVLVFIRQTPRTSMGDITGLPKMIMNQKFASEQSTPLKVEVKENAAPGAYDLAVTR